MHIGEVSDLSIADHLKSRGPTGLNGQWSYDCKTDPKRGSLDLLKQWGSIAGPVTIGWDLIGWESQRIRLATQIGSNLSGVLYILDEPSIGLHQRDNDRLIASLKKMRDLGNTLIVVEHDEDTMRGRLPDRRRPRCRCLLGRSLQQELQSRWLATANPSQVSTCPASARFRFQRNAVREWPVYWNNRSQWEQLTRHHSALPLENLSQSLGFRFWKIDIDQWHLEKSHRSKAQPQFGKTREIQDDSSWAYRSLIDVDQSPIGGLLVPISDLYRRLRWHSRSLCSDQWSQIRGYKRPL